MASSPATVPRSLARRRASYRGSGRRPAEAGFGETKREGRKGSWNEKKKYENMQKGIEEKN